MCVETKIGELSVCELLALGKRVCSTDYAVRFYNNKQHPKFFGNREALVHAVRRAYATGSPSSKGQIEDFIKALPEEDGNEFSQDWKLTCSQDKIVLEFTNRGACALLEDLNELEYYSKGEAYSRLIAPLKQSLKEVLDELKIY